MAIFTNRATVTYDGNEITSNTAQGEIVDPLSVKKYAINETYSVGDIITYVVVIDNASCSCSAVSNVRLVDNLGAYTFCGNTLYPLTYVEGSLHYFVDGVLKPDPTVTSDDGLTVSGLAVPSDGEIMLVYQATVNSFAPLGSGGSITNTVYAIAPGCTQTDTACTTISADTDAVLTVTKSICPVPVTSGCPVTYTFVISNTGAEDATDVVLTDTFDPILSDITVKLNGTTLTVGDDYTYNETTGEFATASCTITVPAATYTQNASTGEWSVNPSSVTLVVTGTI
ncbi:MAG: DUF11 domain-containing protein [Eubacterium sp.]|nr:DUF11 domain-containing protein [Eubacterium sp.]